MEAMLKALGLIDKFDVSALPTCSLCCVEQCM